MKSPSVVTQAQEAKLLIYSNVRTKNEPIRVATSVRRPAYSQGASRKTHN